MNYLLIDYENVQPKSLALLNGHPFTVKVFLGPNQSKVDKELAKTLQPFGKNADYIDVSASGRNALDFHIAFYLGEFCAADTKGKYYIISNDAGFDPLIKHLKSKKIQAYRLKDIAEIPLLRVASGAATAKKVEAIVKNLKSRDSGRPHKVKTLKNTINALFPKSLEPVEMAEIMELLVREGHISIENENVKYLWNGEDAAKGHA